MPPPDRQDKPHTTHSEQGVLNQSFDEKYNVLAFEMLVESEDELEVRRLKASDLKTPVQDLSRFSTNQILEDSGNTYFLKESADGEWYTLRIATNDSFNHATIINNPTVLTYDAALADYTTLDYGKKSEAF